MKRLLTLAAVAAAGAVTIGGVAPKADIAAEPTGHDWSLGGAPGTGIRPSDLIVHGDGTISRSVSPSSPPIQLMCNETCSPRVC